MHFYLYLNIFYTEMPGDGPYEDGNMQVKTKIKIYSSVKTEN